MAPLQRGVPFYPNKQYPAWKIRAVPEPQSALSGTVPAAPLSPCSPSSPQHTELLPALCPQLCHQVWKVSLQASLPKHAYFSGWQTEEVVYITTLNRYGLKRKKVNREHSLKKKKNQHPTHNLSLSLNQKQKKENCSRHWTELKSSGNSTKQHQTMNAIKKGEKYLSMTLTL